MNPAKSSTGKKSRAPKKGRGSNKKIAPSLVALSSAAVLTIYTAGYFRTRSAAEQFAGDGARRRTAGPAEASPVALPAAPRSAVDAACPPTVSALPAAPGSSVPKHDASVLPSRYAPPRSSPAPAAASTPAPVPESTAASTAPPPAAPAAVPTANPIDGDLRTTEPSATPTAPPQPHYKDGTYSGWGTCRHGDIEATVVVEDGRIASAAITQCLTRYSCSWISMLPPQVVSRQSPEVDFVSGATQSTNAFYYAIVEALSKAK